MDLGKTSFVKRSRGQVAVLVIIATGIAVAEKSTGAHSQGLPPYQEVSLPAAAQAGVEPGPGGLLYGVTYDGGANNRGTIFSVPTDLSAVTVLHNFDDTDGRNPYGELTSGGSRLYGATSAGGPFGGGTVFSFDPSTGSLQTLAAFVGSNGRPNSKLLLLGDYLYGSTTGFPPPFRLFVGFSGSR